MTPNCARYGCSQPSTHLWTVRKMVGKRKVIAFYYTCAAHANSDSKPITEAQAKENGQ